MKKDEKQKVHLDWLLKHTEACANRYVEAETMLMNLLSMNWYQRLFSKRKIFHFLQSRNKYNF